MGRTGIQGMITISFTSSHRWKLWLWYIFLSLKVSPYSGCFDWNERAQYPRLSTVTCHARSFREAVMVQLEFMYHPFPSHICALTPQASALFPGSDFCTFICQWGLFTCVGRWLIKRKVIYWNISPTLYVRLHKTALICQFHFKNKSLDLILFGCCRNNLSSCGSQTGTMRRWRWGRVLREPVWED